MAADLVEPAVGLGVDAADEEGRDRGDPRRVAAALDEALQAADVRLGDLPMALEREDQRHVDGDAGGDRLLDRGQALRRRGDLDQQVGLLDQRVQALGLGDRALGVVGEVRVDLERDPAVLAVALVPDGPQDVAGVADVVARKREEDLLRVGLARRELADLVVVGVALGDRALEDRGVGGHADDAVANESGEVAVLDEPAREEVDPDALALLCELLQRGHGLSWGDWGVPLHETVPTAGRGETPVDAPPPGGGPTGISRNAGPGASAGARPVRAARRLRPAHHGAPRADAPPVPDWR